MKAAFGIVCVALALHSAGCKKEPPEYTGPIAPTYENVEKVVRASCTFSNTCHGGTGPARGRMNFQILFDEAEPITEILVDHAACEYYLHDRVEPGSPETSWLYIKLTAPYDERANILFTPSTDWDAGITRRSNGKYPENNCPFTLDGELSFGQLMPNGTGHPTPLSPNRVEMFRQWISLGAPGPGELDAGVEAGINL